ncbi:hypothetical protein M3D76_007160 [Micrococcus luteus]|nr:hypothetical protein [Micrococcus luteus]
MFLIIQGLVRAMVSEPLAAALPGRQALQRAGGLSALWSSALGAVAALAGLALGSPYLIVAGVLAHGYCTGEYAKFYATVFGKPILAVAQEATRLVLFTVACVLFIDDVSPWVIFAVWLAATSVAGYAFALVSRIRLTPTWSRDLVEPKVALSYGADHMLGSGTTQLATFGLGAWAQPSVNAAIRGTGTLLGPVATFVNTGRALIIPFLSRSHRRNERFAPVINLVVVMTALALPLMVLVNLIPEGLGRAVLGDTWDFTRAILMIMSVEALFSLLSVIVFAGHRSVGAHRRTLGLRLVLSPFRLVLIIGGGVVGGPIGAAWATLAATATTAFVWWSSYIQLLRKESS